MNTLDKRNSIALEASAGTGKTFQLSMRVVSMLMSGVTPQDILCLTFTNKATDEMLERIVKVLDEAASGKLPESDKALLEKTLKDHAARIKKEYDGDYFLKSAENARDRLLADFSSIKVKTIDAFSNLILKIFPFEAELRPDYRICTEEEGEELQNEAFYQSLRELLQKPGWKKVFEKVADAMEITAISAAETMMGYAAFSAARRIELKNALNINVLMPEEIETILDAAIVMKKRAVAAARAFGEAFDPEILNQNQLKVYNTIGKITKASEIIPQLIFASQPEEHGYFKKYSFTGPQRKLHWDITSSIKEYLSLKGNAAKALSFALGRILYFKLRQIKNDKNLLTYADIGERAYEMLVTDKPHIDKDYLYFRLDGKINHILIDEFQDTSAVQWLILKPLAEEAMAGVGQNDKDGSFFYVGDPKQNLYRFRGGSSGLFHDVYKSFIPKITKEDLKINYRSDRHIVEFVNDVFKNAAKRFNRKELDIFNIDQKPRPGSSDGYVEIEYLLDKNEEDFTGFVLKKVEEAHKNGWEYGDIAVLVPANKDGTAVKTALTNADKPVPVRLETSRSLADTGVFRAIMALAEFIETRNGFAFFEYAFTETHAFNTDKYADESQRYAIMNFLITSAGSGDLTIFDKIINVVKKCGLYDRFGKEPDFIQTLDVIAGTASDEKNIFTFKEAVSKAAASLSSLTAEENKAVTVMTIHKSKGLQFPLVILPKLSIKLETSATGNPFIIKESLEPGYGSIEFVHNKDAKSFLDDSQLEALEQENALVLQDALNRLYVAMTRAKHALIIGITPPPKSKTKSDGNSITQLICELTEVPSCRGVLTPPSKDQQPKARNSFTIKAEPYVTEDKTLLPKEDTLSFAAVTFGNVLHSAAFLLEGFSQEHVKKALSKALTRLGAFIKEDDVAEIEHYLLLLTQNNDWRELFNGRVFRERKVGIGGGLNSIDFYSLFENRVVLIDYKTGEISPNQQKEYGEQLNAYAAILSNIHKLPVEKFLYHFTKGRLEVIEY